MEVLYFYANTALPVYTLSDSSDALADGTINPTLPAAVGRGAGWPTLWAVSSHGQGNAIRSRYASVIRLFCAHARVLAQLKRQRKRAAAALSKYN